MKEKKEILPEIWREEYENHPFVKQVNERGLVGAANFLEINPKTLQKEILRLRYLKDSKGFAQDHLKILDKNGQLVPLKYNAGQRKITEAKERQIRAGKPIRIALLKARQFGGSTMEEADVFRECMLRGGRSAMIIAHDLDSARHLRDMSSRYYNNYDLPKPKIKKETDKWWKFLHYQGQKNYESNLRIDTAEELSTGHSLTIHHLHLSEIQNWRNATVLVRGLFPTIPNSPDTTIFMEGTGSGVGDYWYDFCQMAMSPDSDWEFVFVAWYEIEDYQTPFPSEDDKNRFMATLDIEEKLLFVKGCTAEQLQWRRVHIRDTYKGDIDAFKQQYPSSPDEAFLTSGRPVFNQERIKDAMLMCSRPKKGNLVEKNGVVKFDEDSRGIWEVWQEPYEETTNYFCGGFDVAQGIEVVPELGIRGGDFSAGKIFNRKLRKFVGKINVRLDPDLYADEIYKASKYWKNLGILIENNAGGSGNVVIRKLKELPNVNLLKTVTVDKVHDTVKQEYGWNTNKESKRIMIDELTEGIREKDFKDFDKDFWYQASTYVRDEKGATNAQSRKYDDIVIAEALALQADKLMPMIFKKRPTEYNEAIYDKGIDSPQVRKKTMTQAQVMEANYAQV